MIGKVPTHTSTTGKAHRLFVAVPLFAVMLAISCIESARLFQQTGSEERSAEWVASQDEHGTMYVSYGQLSVDAGAYRISTWHGAMSVIDDGTTVSVAALTSPVLVEKNGEQWVIPVGMQWSSAASPIFGEDVSGWLKARQPKKLPTHYLQSALPSARALMASVHAETRIIPRASLSLIGQVFQLPAAKERAEQEKHELFLHDVTEALSKEDSTDLEALIAQSNVQTQSERYPVMLALAAEHNRSPLLLPVTEPDLWLQTAFHPIIRDRVWQQLPGDLSTPARLHSLVFLPGSDTAPEPLSELTLKQWMLEWATMLKNSDMPLAIIEAALPFLEEQVADLHKQGFPLRALSYARIVGDLFLGFDDTLNPMAKAAYEQITAMQEELPIAASASSESAEETRAVQAEFALEQLLQWETELRARLTKAGAMFMATSKIQSQTNGMIDVSNVVLGTANGDHILAFIYNPVKDTVRSIDENGNVLPNSVSLEKYLEWVRGN